MDEVKAAFSLGQPPSNHPSQVQHWLVEVEFRWQSYFGEWRSCTDLFEQAHHSWYKIVYSHYGPCAHNMYVDVSGCF